MTQQKFKTKFKYVVICDDQFGEGDTPDLAATDYSDRYGEPPCSGSTWIKGSEILVSLQEVVTNSFVED